MQQTGCSAAHKRSGKYVVHGMLQHARSLACIAARLVPTPAQTLSILPLRACCTRAIWRSYISIERAVPFQAPSFLVLSPESQLGSIVAIFAPSLVHNKLGCVQLIVCIPLGPAPYGTLFSMIISPLRLVGWLGQPTLEAAGL